MKDQIVELAIQAMAELCAHFGEDIPTQAEHDELYSDEESKWFFKRFAELVRNEAQQPAPPAEVPLLSLVEIADITAPWSRVRSDYTIGIARCVEQAVRQKAGLK